MVDVDQGSSTKITLNQLRLFALVVQTGHISAAARQLGISQPSVSQQIRRLENHLGFTLLKAERTNMVVTSRGAEIYRLARGVAESADRLETIATDSRAGIRGTLTVAANSIAAMHFMPEVLQAFAKEYPSVKVALVIGHLSEVMKAVEFGDAMLGFSPGPADYSRFDTEDLFEVEVVLVGSPTDPLARRRRASAAELRHRPIAFADRSRAAIERELRAASIEIDPNLVEVYPDTERAKKAAESGVALAFVVRDAALRELQHRYLVEISVANLEIRRPFEAMWLKGRRLDRFAEAFLRIARERGRQDRTRFRR